MFHDNWQKAYKELQGEVKKLRQEALQQHDELVKLRRTYEDQIYNLDFDNMPKVKMIALQTDGSVAGLVIRIDNTESEVKILAQRQTEQGSAIANIDAKANDNNAQIHQVVLVQEEHNKSMAEITQTAEEHAAEMKRIASVQTEQGESLTEVNQKATENAASIEQVASVQSEQGSNIAAIRQDVNKNASNITSLSSVQTEQGNNIAKIRQDVDKNAADITSVAKVQTEQGESIASVRQSAEANAASISSLASVQTAQGESISNIDQKASENSASISQIAKAQTEQEKTVASIGSKADANAARIEQVALAQDEYGESIASIESKANANAASIGQLASVQTEQGKSIAAIEAKVDEESSEIRLEVQRIDDVAADAAQNAGYARDEASAAQTTADGASQAAENAQSAANEAKANSSNGAYIIARINADGSIVKISADKLELSGYATFASLENEGATSINGANIITGTVDADVLKTGGVGQTGTMLGNNLMFNAGAVKYSDAEARYLFFVDPALYNVFIGVEGGSDAKILRIHSEGNGLFDSYNGERLYLGSIAPGNDLVTRSEVSDMIAAALDGLDVPTEIYAPHISPSSGDYAMPVTVEITNYNSTGDVYYTISGAGNADGTYLYTGPFDIYDTVEDYVTVSAYCRTDYGDSEEASVSYYLSA